MVEIKGCFSVLAARARLDRMGLPDPEGVEEWGMPPNPKLSSPSLDNLGGSTEVQPKRQCVFLSSVLIILNTSVPSLQLQPLPAPQFSGSSLLCSYITLLSEALGASNLLYLLVTNFSHSFLGPTAPGHGRLCPGLSFSGLCSGSAGDWRGLWSRLRWDPGKDENSLVRLDASVQGGLGLYPCHTWGESISLP